MRKKMAFILLMSTMAVHARAAVTDVFDCRMAIVTSDGAEALSQTNRVAMIRKPEGKRNGYIFTRGDARLGLQTKDKGILRKADVHFVIRHALQEGQEGARSAFQSSSLSPVTFFCDKPACLDMTPDTGTVTPGSPELFGQRVAVVNNVPAIDTNQIRESTLYFGSGPQDGVARVSCQHVGTYR